VKDRGKAEGCGQQVWDDPEGANERGPEGSLAVSAEAQGEGVDDAGAGREDDDKGGQEEQGGDNGASP